ncbi:MAG: non-canonical purine NTP pyrophosphatase [Polyangiales bacterium]
MSPPRWLLATNNHGKRAEFLALLPGVELVSLREVGIGELDEPHADFVSNAAAKAREASRRSGLPSLADDSGICVDALAGAPGVFSARFGGAHGDDAENRRRLLLALAGVPAARRGARFRCALALADVAGALGDRVLLAQGTVEGFVAAAPRGAGGFGYDPLFVPLGGDRTLAELDDAQKSALSHRGIAARAIAPVLASYAARR